MAVLLVVVLIAIFVVIICIITHRHKTRKSLKAQHLSIYYQSSQSSISFKGNQFLVGQSALCNAFPIVDYSDYEDTIDEAPEKRRVPDPSTPSYVSVDTPSSSPVLAAAQPSKHCSPPKPPHSAKSPSVPQEDHIYTEVDKSHKTSASSTSPQEDATGSAYTEVDYSKKKSRRGKNSLICLLL